MPTATRATRLAPPSDDDSADPPPAMHVPPASHVPVMSSSQVSNFQSHSVDLRLPPSTPTVDFRFPMSTPTGHFPSTTPSVNSRAPVDPSQHLSVSAPLFRPPIELQNFSRHSAHTISHDPDRSLHEAYRHIQRLEEALEQAHRQNVYGTTTDSDPDGNGRSRTVDDRPSPTVTPVPSSPASISSRSSFHSAPLTQPISQPQFQQPGMQPQQTFQLQHHMYPPQQTFQPQHHMYPPQHMFQQQHHMFQPHLSMQQPMPTPPQQQQHHVPMHMRVPRSIRTSSTKPVPRFDGKVASFKSWEGQFANYLTFEFDSIQIIRHRSDAFASLPAPYLARFILEALSGALLTELDKLAVSNGYNGHALYEFLVARFRPATKQRLGTLKQSLRKIRYVQKATYLASINAFEAAYHPLLVELEDLGECPTMTDLVNDIEAELPVHFSVIFLPMRDQPTIADVWHLLQQYASSMDNNRNYRLASGQANLASKPAPALSASKPSQHFSGSKRQLTCHRCGEPGHTFRQCKSTKPIPPKNPCSHCNGNHWRRDCPKRSQAHVVQVLASPNPPASHSSDATVCMVSTAVSPPVTSCATFIIDSGATHTIVTDCSLLTDVDDHTSATVSIADSTSHPVSAVGTLRAKVLTLDNVHIDLVIPDCYYVPTLTHNLMPDTALTTAMDGHLLYHASTSKYVYNDDHTVQLRRLGDLFYVDLVTSSCALIARSTTKPVAPTAPHPPRTLLQSLHAQLGHRNMKSIRNVALQHDYQFDIQDADFSCTTCSQQHAYKRHQATAATHSPPASIGEVLSVDWIGPFPSGHRGATGAYVFLDHYSGAAWVYPMASKATPHFIEAFQQCLLDSGLRRADSVIGPAILQCDTDTVFWSDTSQRHLRSLGVQTRSSPPYTQAQNGKIERYIRTLKTMTRSLLTDSQLPAAFWPFALSHAALILRQTPSSADDVTTPHSRHFLSESDVLAIIPASFGAPCYAHDGTWSQSKNKLLTSPGLIGTYIGNSSRSPSFLVFIHQTRTIRECDAVIFPHGRGPSLSRQQQLQRVYCLDSSAADQSSTDPITAPSVESVDYSFLEPTADATVNLCTFHSATSTPTVADDSHENIPPVAHANYIDVEHNSITSATKASAFAEYKPSIDSEIATMLDKKVISPVSKEDLPTHAKVINSRFILGKKYDANGNFLKYRSRLVAQGHRQQHGRDYFFTEAPTPSDDTLRVFMALAAFLSLCIYAYDIPTAFLNAPLTEELYLRFPPGLRDSDNSGYYRLHKAIYGLKQSARQWYLTFSTAIQSLGFQKSSYDSCLFFKGKSLVLIYVDDLLIAATSEADRKLLIDSLTSQFGITGGDSLTEFIGITVKQTDTCIQLSQAGYVDQIAQVFPDITNSKPCDNPMATVTFAQSSSTSTDIGLQHQYRKLLGMLMYLLKTRPDLAFPLCRAATVMSNPTSIHWKHLWRIFAYVYHTKHISLTYDKSPTSTPTLFGYTDSDWATDRDTRRSVSSFAIYFCNRLVSWKATHQKSIATSVGEAETIAATLAVKTIVYLRNLLDDLGYSQSTATVLFSDSKSTIDAATSIGTSTRMRHVHVSDLFCREQHQQGTIQFVKVPTLENVADLNTKAHSSAAFSRLKDSLLSRRDPVHPASLP